MEVDKNSKLRIFKQSYDQKKDRDDGLLLKVNHTAPGPKGDIRRTRFLFASFSSCNELLAVADHRGSIFIVDLANSLFWLLGKIPSISLLSFHSHRRDEIFVGSEGHNIVLLNAETGHHFGSLCGHTESPLKVSFSSNGNFCLSVASCEGFIWDLSSLTQAHRLNLQPGMTVKLAVFMPVSDNILACFQDNAIHIWAFQSFQCVKQIVPDTWEGRTIQSIAFTRNGRAMILGGASRQMVIFTVDDWNSQEVVQLPDFVSEVQHVEFLPQSFDSGANKILAVLTSTGTLFFVDLADKSIKKSKIQRSIRNFTCSWSGKYVACKMHSGEVEIYSGMQLLKNTSDVFVPESRPQKNETGLSGPTPGFEPPLKKAEPKKKFPKKHPSKADTILDVNRLRTILKEFLEYPQQYRGIIWRSILRLPVNREPWSSLSERPLHPTAAALSETYPIQNKVMLKCLCSVISCLAYWSPIFGELPYLPQFLFPFIKVFHSDEFECFEVAATLIVNWCQHWFEYLSFPPINVLGMIENVLFEHDMGLLTTFSNAGITSREYAWSLLSTAFSEVLSSVQWQQLWDHVISNPPSFLLFAVVAYNMCCRASLKTCSSKEDFEFFFSNQNPINMKLFIKKCYELMEKTSEENHPSQYLKPFSSLPKGNYPVFSAFPKYIVNYQNEQRNAIQKEEENILKEQHLILSRRLAREETWLRERKIHIHEARLIEAEKAAHAAVQAEEERLIEKRRQLAALRRELQIQEAESAAAARVSSMEQQVKQRSAELDRLTHQLNTRAKISGLDDATLNEEVHDQYRRLITKRQELRGEHKNLNLGHQRLPAGNILQQNELLNLKEQQKLLSEEISMLHRESGNPEKKAVDIDGKLAELDSLQRKVEVVLARKAFCHQNSLTNSPWGLEEASTSAKLKKLENEVSDLAGKLSSITNAYDPHWRCRSEKTERELWNANEQNICLEPSQSGGALTLRSSEFYKKEKKVISSAMELRKSLLSGWHSH